jgi:hypothetical protein
MKKFLIYAMIGFSILVYFTLTVFILPEQYLSKEQLNPQPYFEVEISNSEISLGESFRLNIVSENRGDYGDIHIVSAAFPDLTEIGDVVDIVTYDFTQSPVYIVPGDEISLGYSGGLDSTLSKYPSIEALNRPIHKDAKNHMDFVVTPEKSGIFTIYLKSINIPHTSNLSHYPYSGILDHQDEHVLVYFVNVNP